MNQFERDGIAWWNALTEHQRSAALFAAGPDASIADSYRRHLRDHGYRARLLGMHRVLCNYGSAEELDEWRRGWDAADQSQRSCPN